MDQIIALFTPTVTHIMLYIFGIALVIGIAMEALKAILNSYVPRITDKKWYREIVLVTLPLIAGAILAAIVKRQTQLDINWMHGFIGGASSGTAYRIYMVYRKRFEDNPPKLPLE
jgi:membrane-associated HD superfamily phosphohydrolase